MYARLLALGVAMVLGTGTVRGDVEWETRRVQLAPPPGAAEAVGEFVFVNRGTEPVRVVDVTSGCGCTVAAPEPRVVAPGERGMVQAVFHVGDRRGRQTVAVAVTLEEPEVRVHELTLEVQIRDFVSVAPRLVYWRVGEEPKPKQVQLALAEGFRLVGVSSATPDFTVEVKDQDAATPQVEVKARDTWAKRNGSMMVQVAEGDEPPIEVRVALRIL